MTERWKKIFKEGKEEKMSFLGYVAAAGILYALLAVAFPILLSIAILIGILELIKKALK